MGATLTIGTYVLPGILARFALSHPGVRVHVEIANTAAMARRIREGALSLALVEGPLDDPSLQIVAFQPDVLCLITPPEHRFAGRRAVHVTELTAERFVTREPGSGTRALAESALAAAGVQPVVSLELPTGEGIVRSVEIGLGVAILSRLVVDRAAAEGRVSIVGIEGVDLRRTFRLVTVSGRTQSPAAWHSPPDCGTCCNNSGRRSESRHGSQRSRRCCTLEQKWRCRRDGTMGICGMIKAVATS